MLFHHASARSTRIVQELPFFLLIVALVAAAYLIYPQPQLAMWFGFAVAGYSALANDSIQTLGTFLCSNRMVRKSLLWLFIAGILVFTHVLGWYTSGGDIAFGRLTSIPQPTVFTFATLAGPIILLVLTRLRMPVSTTFLILSALTSTVVIRSMLMKTFIGYIVAFTTALLLWTFLSYLYKRHEFPSAHYSMTKWRVLQACSTAFLWSMWLMQDTANVAVFLPRILTAGQMLTAVGYFVAVLGVLMFFRGGRIQVVVTEKTDITDIRAATIIDLCYGLILLVFKMWNHIPMSTTWVFLGLLAGREIALTLFTNTPKPYAQTAKLVFKDVIRAGAGLLISLLIVLWMV